MNFAAHRQLAWRQWREWRGIVAILTGAGVAMQLVSVANGDTDTLHVVVMFGTLILAGPASLLIAMQAAAGARENGTLPLLLALPVGRVTIAAYEIGGALVACIPPIVLLLGSAVVIFAAHATYRDELSWSIFDSLSPYDRPLVIPILLGVGSYTAAQVCLWTTIVGGRSATRVGAGITAVMVGVVWLLVIVICGIVANKANGRSYGFEFVVALSPFGGTLWFSRYTTHFSIVIQSLTIPLLFGLAVSMWGRSTPLRATHFYTRSRSLRTPYSNPVVAMAWKLWRDVGPMTFAVVGGVLVFAIVFAWDGARYSGDRMRSITYDYVEMMSSVGFLLAVLLAIAAFAGDLRTESLGFWRARPISVGSWFWSRLLVGMALLAGSIYGVALVLTLLTSRYLLRDHVTFFIYLPLQLMTFAVTVWMVCLLRHAIYGGLMGMCLSVGVVSIREALIKANVPILDLRRAVQAFAVHYTESSAHHAAGWWSYDYLQLLVPVLGITTMATWLAWRSVRAPAALEPTRLPWVAE